MSEKILMIDDDTDFTDAVSKLLNASGYETIVENHGINSFNAVKENKPNLLLLDVMMPDSDGFEIARKLVKDEETKNIPIIMLTGIRKVIGLSYKFSPDEEWLPVKAVLEKPVAPELLLRTVKNYI
jgi:CheY-like chemotaxis protein